MGDVLTGKSSGSNTAIQAPQWARKDELEYEGIPAMALEEGDVIDRFWLVTLVVKVYISEPPAVLVQVENMHRQTQVMLFRGSDTLQAGRLPTDPPTKPRARSISQEELSTVVPGKDEEPGTLRPPGHEWVMISSYRGPDDSWDDWQCDICNLRIRSKGGGKPVHDVCSGRRSGNTKQPSKLP